MSNRNTFKSEVLDDVHKTLIEECKALKHFADRITAEAKGMQSGVLIEDTPLDEPLLDGDDRPIIFHALYMIHSDTSFMLARPRRRKAGNMGNVYVTSDIIWPWSPSGKALHYTCSPRRLHVPNPAVLGRQFQQLVGALAEYRRELEYGLPTREEEQDDP